MLDVLTALPVISVLIDYRCHAVLFKLPGTITETEK